MKFSIALVACGAMAAPVHAATATTGAVAAGRYLADAAHCAACHTSRADRPYAGNLAIGSKFGTMYSTNITPDPATGIGAWTEAQFTAALRDGKGRHGEPLYPSMPYADFTKVSDADVHALWLYFRSVPAVVEKTKSNEMKFPFNVRAGVAAWQAVFFRKGRYVPDPSQTEQWNRGAYLVQGLGHCGACHTPKNFAMADRQGHALQGNEIDNWFAPDISGGRFSGIAEWSTTQIVAYLQTGHNDKNVAAVGPMLQTIAQGTQKLAAADLEAIAVYLKNQAAAPETAAPRQAPGWNEERRAAGLAIYAGHCESCHGSDGKGRDGIAPALAGNSSVTSKGPETVVRAVLQGFAPRDRWGVMPSFIDLFDAQDTADVANYVRAAWGGDRLANATPSLVNRMRFAGVVTEPGVHAALMCPSAPVDALDPATLEAIAGAAKANDEAAVPRKLVDDYRRRHPGVAGTELVNTMSGAYCRDVMTSAGGSTVDKQTRVVRFTARIAELSLRTR